LLENPGSFGDKPKGDPESKERAEAQIPGIRFTAENAEILEKYTEKFALRLCVLSELCGSKLFFIRWSGSSTLTSTPI
jgi:hypothetical protein